MAQVTLMGNHHWEPCFQTIIPPGIQRGENHFKLGWSEIQTILQETLRSPQKVFVPGLLLLMEWHVYIASAQEVESFYGQHLISYPHLSPIMLLEGHFIAIPLYRQSKRSGRCLRSHSKWSLKNKNHLDDAGWKCHYLVLEDHSNILKSYSHPSDRAILRLSFPLFIKEWIYWVINNALFLLLHVCISRH